MQIHTNASTSIHNMTKQNRPLSITHLLYLKQHGDKISQFQLFLTRATMTMWTPAVISDTWQTTSTQAGQHNIWQLTMYIKMSRIITIDVWWSFHALFSVWRKLLLRDSSTSVRTCTQLYTHQLVHVCKQHSSLKPHYLSFCNRI